MIGRMNIVARIYFMSMWYVGTPAMILFIIIYAFIGYDTIAANYAGSYGTVLVDGIEVIASNLIYPDWTNVIGKWFWSKPRADWPRSLFERKTTNGPKKVVSRESKKRAHHGRRNVDSQKLTPGPYYARP